jgi:fibronectin-binding autotransporter adhesin
LSIETGRRFGIGGNFSLTPQAQLAYSAIDFDSFHDRFGAAVSLDRAESLRGRLGLAGEYGSGWVDARGQLVRASLYGIANLYYEFLGGSVVNVSGLPLSNASERLWGGLGGGGSYNWAGDQYSVFAELQLNTGLDDFGDSYSVGGTVGFRARF